MDEHAAERRILESLGEPDLVERLAALPGTDFTSLLLAIFRERSTNIDPTDVLRRYRDGRFAAPSPIPHRALRAVEGSFLEAIPEGWETPILSPVAPFGTHHAMGDISQDLVLSTVRGGEVAADPTNALALEAALRRRATDGIVRLATIQPVIRAQPLDAADAYPHFSLFALVTAGRDTGSHGFEAAALAEHLGIHVAGVRAVGVDRVRLLITDWTDGLRDPALSRVEDLFADARDVEVVRDPARESGRGYYKDVCFKIRVVRHDREFEVGDGGTIDWTAKLLSDRKEHTFISGIGLDRLAS